VQVYKLPEERLYATYFGGDAKQGLPADDEAKNIWLKFLPEARVLPSKNNFWGVRTPPPPSTAPHEPPCIPPRPSPRRTP